ncbi:MAG: hypothetical protein ACKODX_00770 [Gemmata sp.]
MRVFDPTGRQCGAPAGGAERPAFEGGLLTHWIGGDTKYARQLNASGAKWARVHRHFTPIGVDGPSFCDTIQYCFPP